MKNLDKLFNKYGLNKLSHGCSTGSEWFSSGETIQSYSPVDGKLNNLSKFFIFRFLEPLFHTKWVNHIKKVLVKFRK